MASSAIPRLNPELQNQLAELEEERLGRFDPQALQWLAVMPLWTEQLAKLCGFPTGDESLPDFIARAKQCGLCESTVAPDSSGRMELNFWMPEPARTTVLARYDTPERRSQLRDVVGELAGRVNKAAKDGADVAPTIASWATVARATIERGAATGEAVNQRIQTLVEKGNSGGALDLIDAAASLAAIVGGELESIAARGKRRLSLEYRRRGDERQLGSFLRRDEQIGDFEQLLGGPDDRWGLHYVGMGGVGKTMLIRYLTTRFAAEHGIPQFPVARVDFDHVSPLYPGERPGQLLLELADELSPHASSRMLTRQLQNLLERVTSLHELAAVEGVVVGVDSAPFADAMNAFAAFVGNLPQPVVLFLDTCEELAKLHPAGQEAPSITATFSLLEQLQGHVRGLGGTVRVVFAGRRLLAASGRDWSLEEVGAPLSAVSYKARPYLALHEIRGFDRDEAERYLKEVRGSQLSSELFEAILVSSVETGRVGGVPRGQSAVTGSKDRYNPYDLALYADWLKESPELDEQIVRSGETDPYVELRIVERLRGDRELADALPTVVTLGRFDTEMLTAALGRSTPGLFERLADQEWIDASPDRELDAVFLEVEPSLRRRIVAFFERQDARRLRSARDSIGTRLGQLVAERPLRTLTVSHVEAALTLLSPVEAARLWTGIAGRIENEEAWPWTRTVCERLLADEGPAGAPDSPVRAGIAASHLGALVHETPMFDSAAAWKQVEDAAVHYADPEAAAALADRAQLGRIAATARELAGLVLWKDARAPARFMLEERAVSATFDAEREAPVPAPDRADLRRRAAAVLSEPRDAALPGRGDVVARCVAEASPATAAATANALDAVLEAQLAATPLPAEIAAWAVSVSEGVDPPLAAFAFSLAARALAREQQFGDARTAFERAEQLAPTGRARQVWNDWVAPDDIRARIRLERLRMERGVTRPPDSILLSWLEETGQLDTIDAERLASSIVETWLEHGRIDEETLDALERADRYRPERRPRCHAHRAVPPLFVTLARAKLALGDGQSALVLLESREREASSTRLDPETVTAAQHALLDVVRRLRLEEQFETLVIRLGREPSPTDDPRSQPPHLVTAARAAGVLVHGLRWESPGDPEANLHDWWSTTPALDFPHAARALGALSFHPLSLRRTELDNAVQHLDRCEAADVSKRLGLPADEEPWGGVDSRTKYRVPDGPTWVYEGIRTIESLAAAERLDEQRGVAVSPRGTWVRLLLRARALSRPDRFAAMPELESIPSRYLGELALEEGELLALRVPAAGANLLKRAASQFGGLNDRGGEAVSAVRAVLALVHAGENEQARALFRDHALPSYRRFTEELDRRGQREAWGGWDKRVASLEAWVAEGSAPEPDKASPELDVRPFRAERFHWLSDLSLSPVLSVVGMLVGLAFMVVAVVTAAKGLELLLEAIAPDVGLGYRESIPLVLVILAVFVLAGRMMSRTRARALAALAELDVEITPRETPLTASVRIRLVPRGSAPWPLTALWTWGFIRETEHVGEIAFDVAAATIELPPDLQKPLESLATRARSGHLRTRIVVQQPLARHAWERMLVDAVAFDSALQTSFAFRRPVASLRRPATARETQVVGIVASPAWGQLLERAWRVTGSVGFLGADPGETPAVRVLHLMGAPTFTYTTDGWNLRLDGQGSGSELEQVKSSDAEGRFQELLSPDRLPATPNALLVVQDEPEDVAGDQLRADGLRSFAADTAISVATPVLTLPSLPPELAEEVVSGLAVRCAAWDEVPSLKTLLQLVFELQRLIVDRGDAQGVLEAHAAALEVTLFTPEQSTPELEVQSTTRR